VTRTASVSPYRHFSFLSFVRSLPLSLFFGGLEEDASTRPRHLLGVVARLLFPDLYSFDSNSTRARFWPNRALLPDDLPSPWFSAITFPLPNFRNLFFPPFSLLFT